jgi:hypothetical protein
MQVCMRSPQFFKTQRLSLRQPVTVDTVLTLHSYTKTSDDG